MGQWISKKNDDSDFDSDIDTKKDLPPKTEIGDQNAMRNLMDDQVVEFFQEKGYEIYHTFDYIKMLIITVACCFAAASHFVFAPENKLGIFFCVGSFGLLNGGLTLFTWYIEGDLVARMKSKRKAPAKHIYVRSTFAKYQSDYTISMEYYNFDKYETLPGKVSETINVGKIFDANGYMDCPFFTSKLTHLLSKFENKKKQ